MAEDPYKLLGVSRSASDAEIRKAYRALAKKLHPDVNPDKNAAERFKNISAAYALLSDKEMKARYDSGQVDSSGQQRSPFAGGGFTGRRGSNGQAGGFQGQGFDDMGDIFSSLFGMQMGGNRGGARLRPKAGADVRYKLTIEFMDAVRGITKKVKMGDGRTLNITIPEGTKNGAVLRLKGKGQPGAHGGRAGDAKVDITVKNHKHFTREGSTLRLDLPISLKEAVLGAKVKAPTPTGSVTLTVPKGSNSGKILRLKGKGVKGGDLLVKLQLVLPKTLPKNFERFITDNQADFEADPRADILA